jgi:methionyl aminopeptidase
LSSKNAGINANYIKAGEITREVRKMVESRDWRGKLYLEICEFVENMIRSKGGEPSFPCNVCADSSTAHYTAQIEDTKAVGERTIVKVDLGAALDGFPTDTSTTLCYNDDLFELVEATKTALSEALKGVKPGTKTNEVGRIVETYAAKRGFVPISNLSGHSLDQYVVHSGTSVPNVWSPSPQSFRENNVYAIEPFFTLREGSGIVVEGNNANIFSIVTRKKTKDERLNRLVDLIWNRRKTLPFAARWFAEDFKNDELNEMLRNLERLRVIRSYPELVEARGMPVAQAEHTIATTAGGFQILT